MTFGIYTEDVKSTNCDTALPATFLGDRVVMAALQALLTLPCTNPSNNRAKVYIKISSFFHKM